MSQAKQGTKQKATPTTKKQTIAAIDIGSNSFHLSVVRVVEGTMQPLIKDKRIVKLANGLDNQNYLSNEAMQRGLSVLESFSSTIKDLDANSVKIVATYTLRRAKNSHVFLRKARQVINAPIEIISGDEEARLIYQGVAHTTEHTGRKLIIDIGGGSTEFAIGEGFNVLEVSSQPLGCITYSKRFFDDGAITKNKFRQAQIFAARRLEIIQQRFIATDWQTTIACSGTARAIVLFQQHYQEDFDGIITLKVLRNLRKKLIELGHTDKIEGIDESRRPILPAGLSILISVFESLCISELTLSEAALREGVLHELADRMEQTDVRERTIQSLIARYDIDQNQVKRVQKTAQLFIDQLPLKKRTEQWQKALPLLDWAIQLYEIGLHINRRGIERHSSYIIANTELPGFSREEQQLLSELLGRYRKKFSLKGMPKFTLYSKPIILLLICTLRLSLIFNLLRQEELVPELKIRAEFGKIKVQLPNNWSEDHPVLYEVLQSEMKIFKRNEFQLKIN